MSRDKVYNSRTTMAERATPFEPKPKNPGKTEKALKILRKVAVPLEIALVVGFWAVILTDENARMHLKNALSYPKRLRDRLKALRS